MIQKNKSASHSLVTKNEKRAVDGIFLLNKPIGITSNLAMKKVQRLFMAEKAGHTGSLDPLATGMLPVCLGEATKFSQYGLDADKTYLATAAWSVQTDSADATGTVIARAEPISFGQAELEAMLLEFIGESEQSPSLFSALKHQGKPLYEYARQGIIVPKKCRTICIYALELLSFDEHSFSLRVHCSKGTYIRTLIEDIAARLGTYAHITALHRESVSGFENTPMVTLEALEALSNPDRDAQLLSTEHLLSDFPEIVLDDALAKALLQGRELALECEAGTVRAYHKAGHFLGLIQRVPDSRYRGLRLVRTDRMEFGSLGEK